MKAFLRSKAERELSQSPRSDTTDQLDKLLLHELHVHQIELEMQNETLRQSQISLEESLERFVDFYDFAPTGYITLSRNGQIAEINLTGAKLLGKERGKLVALRFSNFVAPEERDRWHRFFLSVINNDNKLSCDTVLQRSDGTRLFIQADCLRLRKDGKEPEVRLVLYDISEHMRLKTELLESEIRRQELEQQEIIRTSMDGFWVVNSANGQLLEVNNRYCNMVGYSREEILQMGIKDLDAIETPELTKARIKKIQEVGYDRFETRHRHKLGLLIDLEVSVTHSEVNGSKNFAFFRDITERKRAEEELRSSKAKLDAALASMNDAVLISDSDGLSLEFNDAFVKFHKFKDKIDCQLTLCEFYRLLDLYTPQGELLSLDQWPVPCALRGETASNIEFIVRRKDTGETWVASYSYAPIRDKSGVIVGAVVTGRDVTERNQVIEALKKSEENYRVLFENSSEALLMALADSPVSIVSVNNSAVALFRAKNTSELIGKKLWELSPEHQPDGSESAVKAKQMIERAIQNRSILFEWTHRRLDGETFPTEIFLTCLEQNGQSCIQASIRDITVRKRAEELIHQSRNQLKVFVEQAPISIAMFDLDMNYLAVSDRWIETYSRGHANLIGLNHYVVHPDVPDKWRGVHQQALAGVSLENKEDLWIQNDGSNNWLRWAVHPWIDENHKIGGIIIFAEDITSTKILEMELAERRNEMEQLQRYHVASQTASAIAHEINQPLLAIASYSKAGSMMMKLSHPDNDEIRNAFELSEQQALRAGRSIHDLINFLNKKEFPTESLDLNKEIIACISLVKSESNLEFNSILNLEASTPFVQANRTHVQKVLLNLIHNSIDAMQAAAIPQPVITISVNTAKEQNCVQLTIQDNGPGIKKEEINRLFEPFFSTKSKGIGMGLAISRSLIEENGGKLWVDTQETLGAIFHLTLPFASLLNNLG